jgi:hypothetical protein
MKHKCLTLAESINEQEEHDKQEGMVGKKIFFTIIGSANQNSSNPKLVKLFADLIQDEFNLIPFGNLQELPHFGPELSIDNAPKIILERRESSL